MTFSKKLIHWYLQNERDLPWRKTKDPYNIWLSEIILQQTRVDQGLPYYLKFTEEFPDIFELANAPQEKVLKIWQGLGYYSRARNLHQTARYIANEKNGEFPRSYKGLLELKGVGDYTASAIASICFEENVAVLDGNVFRVLARYFGINTPINTGEGIKQFKAIATELLPQRDPGTYNQALMEFGALQCKPQLPSCHNCPLSSNCVAFQLDKVGGLPVKLRKGKISKKYFNYLVSVSDEQTTVLKKRTGKGIWEGLYEFPLVETEGLLSAKELISHERYLEMTKPEIPLPILLNDEPVVHKLSHQHIYTQFWLVEEQELPGRKVAVAELQKYPVPVLIANFLNDHGLSGY